MPSLAHKESGDVHVEANRPLDEPALFTQETSIAIEEDFPGVARLGEPDWVEGAVESQVVKQRRKRT